MDAMNTSREIDYGRRRLLSAAAMSGCCGCRGAVPLTTDCCVGRRSPAVGLVSGSMILPLLKRRALGSAP
jgi:hypothetical protein